MTRLFLVILEQVIHTGDFPRARCTLGANLLATLRPRFRVGSQCRAALYR